MSHSVSIKPENLYSNCKFYSPDGILMCRIHSRRAEWYLTRGLAEVTEGEFDNPLAIKLNFKPNGLGNHNDPYFTEPIENRCVVCGSEKELTRHHCVPYCFRRYFPAHYKDHLYHDVLTVCVDCHNRYEKVAQEVKMTLVPMIGRHTATEEAEEIWHAWTAAKTLSLYRDNMPQDRIDDLTDRISKAYDCPVDEAIIALIAQDRTIVEKKQLWKMFVDNLGEENLEEFIISWREHFVNTMNPQYMSPHWSIDGRISRPIEETQ